ncbi:MAG: TlyA family RNA methyltransferase [Candidatus Bipolaricaulota bacterium]|nr:TlyA family RNA methyltransferase [Candidatus Bipolaricaulota bacterium]
MSKERLDKLVTQRRLIRSRTRAQRMIMAGRVRVDGRTIYRPGHRVRSEAELELIPGREYVSRGGKKLAGALADFRIDPQGAVCLDVGSSTGGFTDCLLQNGAARVHAVDVGTGQLDWGLRNDRGVLVHEGINARYLTMADIGEEINLATIDVAFISLRHILPPLCKILSRNGEIIALVKPQFEAGRDKVERGGVVTDRAVHLDVLRKLQAFVEEKTPLRVAAATHSSLTGPAGNIEFFFLLQERLEKKRGPDLEKLVERAHIGLG